MTNSLIRPLYLDPTHLVPREADPTDVVEGSYGDITKEPSGFPDRLNSVISFDDLTRTFSITPVNTSFDVYIGGFKKTFTTQQDVQIGTNSGLYWIYFSRATNQLQFYLDGGNPSDIILNHTPVAIVYWDGINSKAIYMGDERHGIVMDSVTHAHLHQTLGAQYRNGLDLLNLVVDGDGSVDSHCSVETNSGRIADEDLELPIASQTTCQPVYRVNGVWHEGTVSNVPLVMSTRPMSNEFISNAWALVETQNNKYLLTHIIATNCKLHPIKAVIGKAYSTKTAARAAALSEFLTLSGLPFSEFVPIATLIYQVNDSYTNTFNARLVSSEDGSDYIDWRSVRSFVASAGQSALIDIPDVNPTFTYTDGLVTRIDYSNGNYKTLTYNVDQLVSIVDYHRQGVIFRKEFFYSPEGFVTSINETTL